MNDWFETTGTTVHYEGHVLHELRVKQTFRIKETERCIIAEPPHNIFTSGTLMGLVEYPELLDPDNPSFISPNSRLIGYINMSNSVIYESIIRGFATKVENSLIQYSFIEGCGSYTDSRLYKTSANGIITAATSKLNETKIVGNVSLHDTTVNLYKPYGEDPVQVYIGPNKDDIKNARQSTVISLYRCTICHSGTITTSISNITTGAHNPYVARLLTGETLKGNTLYNAYYRLNVMAIPYIGSRNDTLYAYMDKEGEIYVKTGCFDDTLEAFRVKVANEHEGYFKKVYDTACDLIETTLCEYKRKENEDA